MTRPPLQASGRRPSVPLLLLLTALLAVASAVSSPARAQDAAGSAAEETRDPSTYTDDELYADEEIEERVVLAGESEAAAAFDSGDSVTGFNAADLEAVGAFNVADLAKFTPNLEIVTAGSTSPTFFIRGVGLNDFNPNSSGAVAIYQDDVPINSPALQLGLLFDVEAVNIERGPQGTGPARNASAGAIKVYARRPSGDYGATFSGQYGRFNSVDVEGAVEAPIVEDVLSSRFAFRLVNRDGFAKNGCGDAPPRDQRGVRTQGSSGSATDPRWSICGETVLRENQAIPGTNPVERSDGISEIPEGLPSKVNDQDNWAARGTFLFEPTLDTEFLLSAHGGIRDEYSRLGQSAGTTGFFCDPSVNIDDCVTGPVADREGVINGRLGGPDGGGYQEPDILRTFRENEARFLAACDPCSVTEQREANNLAKIATADKVADDLDRNPFRGDYDKVGRTKNEVWGGVLKGDIALPWGLDFNFVTGVDGYDRETFVDLDFSPNILFEIATEDDGVQFAQSAEIAGRIPTPAPIDWQIGGFALYEKLNVKVNNDFGALNFRSVAARDYTQETTTLAAYASFSWDFWEDFTLDGGIRYNYDHKEIDYELFRQTVPITDNQETSWDHPTGTVRLTYRFAEGIHASWKYTHGWKGGHYNATSSLTQGVTSADPEKIDAFEFGLRGAWLDGRIGLDASLFYYEYQDYQLFTVQQTLGLGPEFVVLNASDARMFGAELSGRFRPWTGALIEANWGWLESKFLDFIQVSNARRQIGLSSEVVTVEIDNSGNRLLNSPRFKLALTAEQEIPLGGWGSLIFRYDAAWSDDTYFDPTQGRGIPNSDNIEFLPENTIGQSAYWLHNLRAAYTTPDGMVEIAGWIRNIEDKAYKTFAFDGSTFQQTTVYFVGDPRTYGLTLNVRFY